MEIQVNQIQQTNQNIIQFVHQLLNPNLSTVDNKFQNKLKFNSLNQMGNDLLTSLNNETKVNYHKIINIDNFINNVIDLYIETQNNKELHQIINQNVKCVMEYQYNENANLSNNHFWTEKLKELINNEDNVKNNGYLIDKYSHLFSSNNQTDPIMNLHFSVAPQDISLDYYEDLVEADNRFDFFEIKEIDEVDTNFKLSKETIHSPFIAYLEAIQINIADFHNDENAKTIFKELMNKTDNLDNVKVEYEFFINNKDFLKQEILSKCFMQNTNNLFELGIHLNHSNLTVKLKSLNDIDIHQTTLNATENPHILYLPMNIETAKNNLMITDISDLQSQNQLEFLVVKPNPDNLLGTDYKVSILQLHIENMDWNKIWNELELEHTLNDLTTKQMIEKGYITQKQFESAVDNYYSLYCDNSHLKAKYKY